MASNSSIIVSDEVRGLYAYGYQHNNGEVTYQDLMDSAISANKDWNGHEGTPLTPEMFLAEWHKLALKKWENPSELTVEAIENLAVMAKEDAFHFDVDMDRGYIDTITCYSYGEQVFSVQF